MKHDSIIRGFVLIDEDNNVLTYADLREFGYNQETWEDCYNSGRHGVDGLLRTTKLSSGLYSLIIDDGMTFAAVQAPQFLDRRLAAEPAIELTFISTSVRVDIDNTIKLALDNLQGFTSITQDGDITFTGKYSAAIYKTTAAFFKQDLTAMFPKAPVAKGRAPVPGIPTPEEVARAFAPPPVMESEADAFARAFSNAGVQVPPPTKSKSREQLRIEELEARIRAHEQPKAPPKTAEQLRIEELEARLAAHEQAQAASNPWHQPLGGPKSNPVPATPTDPVDVVSMVEEMFGFLG